MIRKILSLLFIALSSLINGVEHSHEMDFPHLVVRGEALLFKPADQIEVSVGVVTEDVNPQKALQLNNEKMAAVIKELNDVGLTTQEYRTGQFQVRPVYTNPPKDPPADWRQKISHYEVTNTLQIKTQKLDIAGRLLSVASQAGSNRIDHIQFDLKNPREFRAEAIQKATQNAIDDATLLAEASHVKLVKVRYVALDPSQNHFPAPRMMMAKFSGEALSDVPLEAGDVEVRAVVEMIFEVGSLKD